MKPIQAALFFSAFLFVSLARSEDAPSEFEIPQTPPSSQDSSPAAEPATNTETPTSETAARVPDASTLDPDDPTATTANETIGNDVLFLDFENPDVFIDESEALRSKQYVRRAILSSVIATTSKFSFSRVYLNHLMGFSAVFQRTRFAKYTSGLQSLSLGYITEGGHGFEGGLEISAVSNLFGGYRFVFRPEKFSIWPFAGVGGGTELGFAAFADGPPESQNYGGMKQFGFFTMGVMVPLVDVALKAEFRANFYKLDRLMLTSGVGAVVFF